MAAPERSHEQIDREIAEHRRLYLAAIWAGHDGEALDHEQHVDELLDELWRTRAIP